MRESYDVAVIGAGVLGCAVARLLSRFEGAFAVLEREHDVGTGASSRNSGVIHAGINYSPGTLRAQYCMEGRKLLRDWCEELNVPHRICGKLVLARSKEESAVLERLLAQGSANGVPDLRIVSREEAASLQSGLECVAALHVPSSGIVSPYALTIALAEDAAVNGVDLRVGTAVLDMRATPGGFEIGTTAGTIGATCIVNAAGVHAGRIARLLDPGAPEVYGCIGEYLVLDKRAGETISMSVYPAPGEGDSGLGVHITPTVDGNLLLGPSSEYVCDPESTGCT
ncbi:MAG: NAD(P)/FAD-dependent oxidoreductase, partial [Candidatus Bipolaricaulota bacterium]